MSVDTLPIKGNAHDGYIALLSVLFAGAIASTTIIILLITSLNMTLTNRDMEGGMIARLVADACAENALQTLTNGRTEECTVPDCGATWFVENVGSCAITSMEKVSTDGDGNIDWRLRVTGSGVGFLGIITASYIEIDAFQPASGDAATVTSWRECMNFDNTPCTTE